MVVIEEEVKKASIKVQTEGIFINVEEIKNSEPVKPAVYDIDT